MQTLPDTAGRPRERQDAIADLVPHMTALDRATDRIDQTVVFEVERPGKVALLEFEWE